MTETSTDSTSSKKALNFSQLILGFSSAALLYLGETSIEGKENPAINLPLAKYNIDIIKLLKEKSKGNLSEEEEKLINDVITDLQLKYSSHS